MMTHTISGMIIAKVKYLKCRNINDTDKALKRENEKNTDKFFKMFLNPNSFDLDVKYSSRLGRLRVNDDVTIEKIWTQVGCKEVRTL